MVFSTKVCPLTFSVYSAEEDGFNTLIVNPEVVSEVYGFGMPTIVKVNIRAVVSSGTNPARVNI